MVATTTISWISDFGTRFNNNNKQNNKPTLGILAFETAKIMSRLVATYKSLSNQEIHRLTQKVITSQGVAYLNSSDQNFLLNLACAERLEDLDKMAVSVARLGTKCSDYGVNRFDQLYGDLKLGRINLEKFEYGSREIEKRIEKIDRLVHATTSLYTSLESLAELEISEKKLQQWKKNITGEFLNQKMNFDLFEQKIANQRKQVRYFKEMSLWSKTFDKNVSVMARLICVIYARICLVFGPHIVVLPKVTLRHILFMPKQTSVTKVQPEVCLAEEKICTKSGLVQHTCKTGLVRFYSRKSIIFVDNNYGTTKDASKNNWTFHSASKSTLGGSGLALRYANVILLLDKFLDLGTVINRQERDNLYEMLPENIKCWLKLKLRRNMKGGDRDESLAEGWRVAVETMMAWLVPMARDTMRWQQERSYEEMTIESKTPVLLMQTFHFADKEKTETAIAEVLVALSCMCQYGNHGVAYASL